MKKLLQLLLVLCVPLLSKAQNITYKVIKDQPDDAANYYVNFGLLDMGLNTKNLSGSYLGFSLSGMAHVKNKLGGEFTFRRSYLSFGDGPYSQFELGGFYHLASKSKIKNQKIVLSSKSRSYGGKTYTETISMKVPASRMKSYGVRGGLVRFKEFLEAETDKHGFTGDYMMRSTGLYGGLLMTTQANAKVHTKEYGIRGTGYIRRNYVDVLFTPVRSIRDFNTEVENEINKPGVLGWRIGVEFLNPEPRKMQGNAIYQKFEIGNRPYNGYYFMYSLGINFKRKVKSLSSFVPVREKE
jgi:hypothetical protein